MNYRYSDPAMDAEAYYHDQSVARELWEREHYVGRCPICGHEMYTDSSDYRDRAAQSDKWGTEEGWVHEFCLECKEEQEEADEMYELDTIQRSLEERLSEIA